MSSFASQEYWDARFSKDSSPFDWLVPTEVLCDVASASLKSAGVKDLEILNIGCGTSESSKLCALVQHPSQIHNVDFSEVAVDAGIHREQKVLEHDQVWQTSDSTSSGAKLQELSRMRWSCLDLMKLRSTFTILEGQDGAGRLVDLVLDKSTSDSISTGPDVRLQLPYTLSINGWTRGILQSGILHQASIHPLHVLAVHLAALTTPRTGRWIVISYSEYRFPFLRPYPPNAENGLLTDEVIKAGFPHPNQLWRLEKKEQIDLGPDENETLAERKKRLAAGPILKPAVKHWLYILARTDVVVTD